MSIPHEQVEAWMRGLQLEKTLSPFQVLVFRLYICKPVSNASKLAFEKSLHNFRVCYLHKFLFEHQTLSEDAAKFMKVIREFEENKKPTKKDYVDLFEKLCAYKSEDWPGGHVDGEPVLLRWRPSLQDCGDIYSVWYKDEVKSHQDLLPFSRNHCAVTGKKYSWQDYIGTRCPANIRVYSEEEEPTDVVKEYYKTCEPYALTVRPEIEHISKSFEMAYEELCKYQTKERFNYSKKFMLHARQESQIW